MIPVGDGRPPAVTPAATPAALDDTFGDVLTTEQVLKLDLIR
ncbi:hypothetical protein [Burkholderia ubonensis]|nr:hypothetical protein [Burkholderia ubonensis]